MSTILISTTSPCCDSGLPRDTQNGTAVLGNDVNDDLLKKDYPLRKSKILPRFTCLVRVFSGGDS